MRLTILNITCQSIAEAFLTVANQLNSEGRLLLAYKLNSEDCLLRANISYSNLIRESEADRQCDAVTLAIHPECLF